LNESGKFTFRLCFIILCGYITTISIKRMLIASLNVIYKLMYDFQINAGNFVPLLMFLANKNSKISSNYPAASRDEFFAWWISRAIMKRSAAYCKGYYISNNNIHCAFKPISWSIVNAWREVCHGRKDRLNYTCYN
jgi:hypothetical protein